MVVPETWTTCLAATGGFPNYDSILRQNDQTKNQNYWWNISHKLSEKGMKKSVSHFLRFGFSGQISLGAATVWEIESRTELFSAFKVWLLDLEKWIL